MKTLNPVRRYAISVPAFTVAVLFSCTALLTLPSPALAGGSHPNQGKELTSQVFPPHAKFFDTTYSELAGAWWNWVVNQPVDMNPLLDETGEFCHVGQNEDFGQGKKIFFLAGNTGGETVRSCTIPKHAWLFFPVFNTVWWTPEDGTLEEVREFSNSQMDTTSVLECVIDGVPVEDIFAYRIQSPPGGSPLEARPGSLLEAILGYPRGPEPAVADGYWLLVKLGDGKEHEIVFRGVGDASDPAPFEVKVTYNLTVGK